MHAIATQIHAARIAHAAAGTVPERTEAAARQFVRRGRKRKAAYHRPAAKVAATPAVDERIRRIVPGEWQAEFIAFIRTGEASQAFTSFLSRHKRSYYLWLQMIRETLAGRTGDA